MNTKHILLIIAIVAIAIGFALFGGSNNGYDTGSGRGTDSAADTNRMTGEPYLTGSASSTASTTAYSLADVAAHNNKTDCWTAINGNVYDVTAWISKHPGGSDAIIYLCGKDGTAAFAGQHGDKRRPANELAGFKIGTLR